MQVGDGQVGVDRAAVQLLGQDFGIAREQPVRQAAVQQLRILVGSRAHDRPQPDLLAELEEALEIELGFAEVELAFFWFVQQPGDVGGGAVAAGVLELLQAVLPALVRHAEVVQLAGDEEDALAVGEVAGLVELEWVHASFAMSFRAVFARNP